MRGRRTRREFLSKAAKAVGGAVCLSACAGAAVTGGEQLLRGELTSDTFAALLNTTFVVESGAMDKQRLLLVKVEKQDSPQRLTDSKLETFSLLFKQGGRGAEDGKGRLSQNTYRFFHPALGDFEMFIVPVLRPEGKGQRQRYEAVFSRLV